MRVVLDANLPVDFGTLLTGHDVDSAHQRGWSDLDNGELLTASQAEYDAFLTLDQSLRYQQNLRGRPIAVLILHARSNRLQDLSPLVPAIPVPPESFQLRRGDARHCGSLVVP